MKIVPITCPNCHANLKVEEGRKYCFCEYCGTKVLLDDEAVTFVYRDEAKLKELELLERERKKQEEDEKRRIREQEEQQAKYEKWKKKALKIMIGEGAAIILPLLLSILFEKDNGPSESVMLIMVVVVYLCFFGFPIYLTATRPEKPGEKKKNKLIRYLQILGINFLTFLVSAGVIEVIGLLLLKICGFI